MPDNEPHHPSVEKMYEASGDNVGRIKVSDVGRELVVGSVSETAWLRQDVERSHPDYLASIGATEDSHGVADVEAALDSGFDHIDIAAGLVVSKRYTGLLRSIYSLSQPGVIISAILKGTLICGRAT